MRHVGPHRNGGRAARDPISGPRRGRLLDPAPAPSGRAPGLTSKPALTPSWTSRPPTTRGSASCAIGMPTSTSDSWMRPSSRSWSAWTNQSSRPSIAGTSGFSGRATGSRSSFFRPDVGSLSRSCRHPRPRRGADQRCPGRHGASRQRSTPQGRMRRRPERAGPCRSFGRTGERSPNRGACCRRSGRGL